jgi:tetratricopeptide (TPR) repeat protein
VAAVKAFEKARLELIDQKPDKAAHDLQKAVQAYPQFAEAWYQLGRIQQEENSGEARASFTKAAEADPQFVLPYEQLASVAAQEQKWQEVVDHSGRAMTLNPGGTAQTWYFNALGNFQLGKTDDAEAAAMKALSMDPNHTIPNTEQLLAVILAKKGDRGGAVMHLRNCLTYVPEGPSADLIHKQIALLQGKAATAK